jgi:phosphoheptose isomerase
MKKIKKYFLDVSKIIEKLNNFEKEILEIKKIILTANKLKRKIFVIGNGGSAADSDHFAGELICTFNNRKRKPFEIYSLNQNNVAMTAWSNDFSYESYLERCLKAYSKKNDVLICLTTSGGNIKKPQSKNLIRAVNFAKKNKILVVSLTGRTGGYVKRKSDININIESQVTSYIQEAHMSILHCICDLLEKEI